MKTTTTAAVAAALALAGCAAQPAPMEHATRPVAGKILWIVHDDAAAMDAERRQIGGAPLARHLKLDGFAVWTGLLPGGACVIHTMWPGAYGADAVFGRLMAHEFRHCVEGSFHD